jgi:hypothetical protein
MKDDQCDNHSANMKAATLVPNITVEHKTLQLCIWEFQIQSLICSSAILIVVFLGPFSKIPGEYHRL